MEEAYRHEKETKEEIEEVLRSSSMYHLQDNLDAADDGADENRLLPAMNKLWPFLVICIQSNNPVVSNNRLNCSICYKQRKDLLAYPYFHHLLSLFLIHHFNRLSGDV